jgi:microcystin-dependent protein
MSMPFLGEIVMFGYGQVPPGFAPCDGQLMAIASNAPLFSILGTSYGGDGSRTFALPDLRARAPLYDADLAPHGSEAKAQPCLGLNFCIALQGEFPRFA